VFAAHDIALDVSMSVAQARLANMARSDALSDPSRHVYEDGLAQIIRVGPVGGTPWLSKLVRVRFLDPVYRQDTMTIGLRWEATGAASGFFPVLDADITLRRAGEHTTRLALAGSYRPPMGWFGATLDRTVLHQVAAATVRALLHQVAEMLTSPAPALSPPPDIRSDPVPAPFAEPEETV
jgi:hypothetical protein